MELMCSLVARLGSLLTIVEDLSVMLVKRKVTPPGWLLLFLSQLCSAGRVLSVTLAPSPSTLSSFSWCGQLEVVRSAPASRPLGLRTDGMFFRMISKCDIHDPGFLK